VKAFFIKLVRKEHALTDEFSRFFRETPLDEKKRVLGEAVRKSSEDQKALVDRYLHHCLYTKNSPSGSFFLVYNPNI